MVRGVVALLVVVAGSHAVAAEPVRLEVNADACDFRTLESQLTEMLGSNPIDPSAHASVRVHVTKQNGLEARVTFDDGDGELRGPRIVTSTNCSDLVKSVAIVIAMAIPDLPARAPLTDTAEPAPVADTSPPASAPPHAAPAVKVASEPMTNALAVTVRDSSPRSGYTHTDLFVAGAGGLTSAGVQEQLIVGVRVRRDSASLSAEIRADAPEEHDVERMGGISVFRAQLSVSPCLHVGSVAGCAVASAGTIHGSGVGLTSARSASTPLVAGGLRLTWEHRLVARISLRLHLDGDALLTSTQFDVDNMKVWVSPRFEGAVGVGVIAHFP